METFGNGDFYNGEYSRDKFHGTGELLTAGGKYSGEFRFGIKDGFGKMVFKNGCKYEGKWKNGRFEGKGLYVWTGWSIYVKVFSIDGLECRSDGRKYEGEWVAGERTGAGVLSFTNGEKYGTTVFFCFSLKFCLLISFVVDGAFVRGLKHGSGWWRFTNGKVRPGEWKDDALLRWTGPEQFEVQMKARRIRPKA